MSVAGSYLGAGYHFEAVFSFLDEVERLHRTTYVIVIGDGDYIEVGVVFYVVENLLDTGKPIPQGCVHMEVGLAGSNTLLFRPRLHVDLHVVGVCHKVKTRLLPTFEVRGPVQYKPSWGAWQQDQAPGDRDLGLET